MLRGITFMDVRTLYLLLRWSCWYPHSAKNSRWTQCNVCFASMINCQVILTVTFCIIGTGGEIKKPKLPKKPRRVIKAPGSSGRAKASLPGSLREILELCDSVGWGGYQCTRNIQMLELKQLQPLDSQPSVVFTNLKRTAIFLKYNIVFLLKFIYRSRPFNCNQ